MRIEKHEKYVIFHFLTDNSIFHFVTLFLNHMVHHSIYLIFVGIGMVE